MTTICSAEGLSYSIDGKQILNSQSFILKNGDFFEIRGKNGSGKSTLLKILCKVIDNSSLQTINNFKKNLSYLGHKNAFVEELTMQENFNLDDLKCDIGLAKLLNIQNLIDEYCLNLSFGEKRKFAIMRVFQSNKRYWILDEPFASLDKDSCDAINQQFISHIGTGGLVVITNNQDSVAATRKLNL